MIISFPFYTFLVTVLLLLFALSKHNNSIIYLQCIAVLNALLLWNAAYLINQLYHLYKLAAMFPNTGKSSYTVGWFDVKLGTQILIPFIFLGKRNFYNKWLTLILLLVLWFDMIRTLLREGVESISVQNLSVSSIEDLIKILNFICAFIAVYALLWLLKKLPFYKSES
ncbi:MAG: hypothetical protein KGO81_03120 [Bacteroidota bacterium]|nr:hypothetical protein [Bacteroidota bacterium]